MGQQSRDVCIRFSSYVVQALLLATSPRTGASFHGTTMECSLNKVWFCVSATLTGKFERIAKQNGKEAHKHTHIVKYKLQLMAIDRWL